jgi:uncharacterized membrane protein YhaH (DUF805 family)
MDKDNNTKHSTLLKFCSNCGKKLEAESKFCQNCGTATAKEITPTETPAEEALTNSRTNSAYVNASGTVYVIGTITLIFGAVLYFLDKSIGSGTNFTIIFVIGLVFLGLGYLVQRKSLIALLIAIAIYGWDTVNGVGTLLQGNFLAISFLVWHIIFLIAMLKGVGAIWALKHPDRDKLNNRLNRRNFSIALVITVIVFSIVAYILSDVTDREFNFMSIVVLALLLLSPLFLVSFSKRRFHDLGQSGWRILLLFIPIVGMVFAVLLFSQKGQRETNKYGNPPEPKIDFKSMFGIGWSFSLVAVIIIILAVSLPQIKSATNLFNQINSHLGRGLVSTSPGSIDMGRYEGRNYSNSYFGVSFTIPNNVYIINNKTISGGFKINPAYHDDQPGKELLQQLQNEQNLYLTIVSTNQYNVKDGSSFGFACEKIPAYSTPSSDTYLETLKTQLKNSSFGYTFTDTIKKPIGSVVFSTTKATYQSVTQDYYVAQRNGYYIFFVNSYLNNADKKTLDNILATVKFTDPVDEGWLVDDFQSYISVEKTGEVQINEMISVDFKNLAKKGIVRDIPFAYTVSGNTTYSDITIKSVQLNSSDAKYQVSRGDKFLTVKIGDPNQTISGKNTYSIEYTVKGGILKSLSDKDELYWNVTGNNWTVPISHIQATVTFPDSGIIKTDCFEGLSGATANCSSSTPTPLSAGFNLTGVNGTAGGMTIVVDYKKDMVSLLKVGKAK